MSASTELLSCPWCGSLDIKIYVGDGIEYAQCANCTACGPDHKEGRHWNTLMARKPPSGCYCPPGRCFAPKIMGHQTPCLRRSPPPQEPSHG